MIDELDRGILSRLATNSRTPYRKIAEELGVSESTVFVRVKKMVDSGVITRFTLTVDPKKAGRPTGCFILISADPNRYEKVLSQLAKLPDVLEIHDLAGQYDIILKVRTSSQRELTRILDTIGSIDGVLQTQTSVVLRTLKEDPFVQTGSES